MKLEKEGDETQLLKRKVNDYDRPQRIMYSSKPCFSDPLLGLADKKHLYKGQSTNL